MMRNGSQGGRVRLGGTNIHVAKHLRRIDTDQLERKATSKLEGERRLAAGRRAH